MLGPDRSLKNIVGRRVKEARGRFRPPLTQDQLSARLATLGVTVDRAAIAKIEGGGRRVADFELKALARALALDIRWLLGLPDGKSRQEPHLSRPKGRA